MLSSQGKFKKLEDVLKKATESIPFSVELWQQRLNHHLSKDGASVGVAVFRDGMAQLGSGSEAALPLWETMLNYYQTNDMCKAEQMFQDGVVQGRAISVALKPLYLEWLVSAKGELTIRLKCQTGDR
jgi:hypothetical protein